MPLPGGVLRVSVLHGADADQTEKLHEWLSRVTKAILSVNGMAATLPASTPGVAVKACCTFWR